MERHVKKLGIACVYFFRDDDAWILDLQLDYIERYTAGYDFTVYAAANRLQNNLRQRLEARPFVKIVTLEDHSADGGPEHGHYLKNLLDFAKADGCDYLCTLDCDSFPTKSDWPALLVEQLGENGVLASVFRSENLDTDLPHPCGTFLKANLIDKIPFSFYPDTALQEDEKFKSYIVQTGQRIDTGTGLGFALWDSSINWKKLYRSNKKDHHFLMAGMYGDIFFHVGAGSRDPDFHRDLVLKTSVKIANNIGKYPIIWRIARKIMRRHINKNRKIADFIRAQLQANSDAFIEDLR